MYLTPARLSRELNIYFPNFLYSAFDVGAGNDQQLYLRRRDSSAAGFCLDRSGDPPGAGPQRGVTSVAIHCCSRLSEPCLSIFLHAQVLPSISYCPEKIRLQALRRQNIFPRRKAAAICAQNKAASPVNPYGLFLFLPGGQSYFIIGKVRQIAGAQVHSNRLPYSLQSPRPL
jgi:hypothetical protein